MFPKFVKNLHDNTSRLWIKAILKCLDEKFVLKTHKIVPKENVEFRIDKLKVNFYINCF